MTLTIIHPRALCALAHLPTQTSWFYADDDTATDQRITHQFGAAQRLLTPAAFQAKAAGLRHAFVAWVDACLENSPTEDLIASSFFKDIFLTPVFLHAAALGVLHEALDGGHRIVVITTSMALMQQLQQLKTHQQPSRILGRSHFVFDAYLIRCKAWGHWIWRPLRLLLTIFLARCLLGAKQRLRLRNTDILIDAFILDGDLQADGKFRERFLPGLIDYYLEQGHKAAFLARTGNISFFHLGQYYRAMRRSSVSFALGELFLHYRDVLIGAWRTWQATCHPPPFAKHSLTDFPIDRLAHFWWRIATLKTVIPRTLTLMGQRMHDHGLTPKLVLDWYENQSIDKATHIAFTKTKGSTRVVAVRQYFPAANVINFFTTSGEVQHGAAPAENWVCGRRTAELFAQHDRQGSYSVVPALRYAQLHQMPAVSSGKSLIIFLTSSLEESLSILAMALDHIDITLQHFQSVQIKAHQALDSDFLSWAQRRWPHMCGKAVVWETASSGALLQHARLVLTAGSSVAVEALCWAVPVVIAGRTAGLDVNPLEDIEPTLWRMAYTSEEFIAALKDWLPHIAPLAERKLLGQKICTDYFEPVAASSMRAFLPNPYV